MQTAEQRALESAIRANPKDLVRWYALADYIAEREEDGLSDPEFIRIFGEWAAGDLTTWSVCCPENQQVIILAGLEILCHTSFQYIIERLYVSNYPYGRGYTLSLTHIAETAVGCIGQVYKITGGKMINTHFVSNCVQTVCLAVQRPDGKVRVDITTALSSKNVSLVRPFGFRKNSKPEEFIAWSLQSAD